MRAGRDHPERSLLCQGTPPFPILCFLLYFSHHRPSGRSTAEKALICSVMYVHLCQARDCFVTALKLGSQPHYEKEVTEKALALMERAETVRCYRSLFRRVHVEWSQ